MDVPVSAADTRPQAALMATALALSTSVEALAALAAHLRVETEEVAVDPRTRAHLAAVADELLGSYDGLAGGASPVVVGMTRAFLSQAADLIEHPGRVGGWDRPDEVLLQGMGRMSGSIADAIRAAEDRLPGLRELLRSGAGTFLDVGTGTGWLSIAMARAYPDLRVVGIDIFDPALEVARRNVAEAGLADRIELRRQDGSDLAGERYDVIWLPMPFLPFDTVPRVLQSCRRALRPGGWLLPGTFAGPDDRLSELLRDLRTVRCGGHPWQPDHLVRTVGVHGFVDVCEVPRTWAAPVGLFAGRRPPGG